MRLIDADFLKDVLKADGIWGRYFGLTEKVDECPTIEPVQGEWAEKEYFLEGDPECGLIIGVCSICGKQSGCTSFCPHCGAKMKGGEA